MKLSTITALWSAAYLCCLAVALVLSPRLLISATWQFTGLFLVVGFLTILVLSVAAIISSPHAPLSWIRTRPRFQLVKIIYIALACSVGMAAFWVVRFHLAMSFPFWADPYLASIDRVIHFGEPWRWLHSIVPRFMAGALVLLYFPIWQTLFIAGILVASGTSDAALCRRYFMALTLIHAVLGILLATLFSSVGPMFYDTFFKYGPPRFSELLDALRENHANNMIFNTAGRVYSAFAARAPDSSPFLTSISAMPSISVAVATLNAIFVSKLGRFAAMAGWTFVALTLFGSVYFGWHYAIDGYVSILAVIWFWRLTERLIES